MNKINKKIVKIANILVSDYIYDPNHSNNPGGGYHQTERGWSNINPPNGGNKNTGGDDNKKSEDNMKIDVDDKSINNFEFNKKDINVNKNGKDYEVNMNTRINVPVKINGEDFDYYSNCSSGIYTDADEDGTNRNYYFELGDDEDEIIPKNENLKKIFNDMDDEKMKKIMNNFKKTDSFKKIKDGLNKKSESTINEIIKDKIDEDEYNKDPYAYYGLNKSNFYGK